MDHQKVADFLLKEGYLLTALELHVELSEKGKPLTVLSQFFQDCKNFEAFTRTTSSPQSSTCGGFDDVASSIFDLTRNSEDSHWTNNPNDDRVAVLEFELRKARETIFNLREELTQQTKNANETDTLDQVDTNNSDEENEDDIKAHEKRIINFLINEYLLQHGFKLTSITFSDENSDPEYFEDWDNIGINVTKPPNLLRLYKDFGKHFDGKTIDNSQVEKREVEVNTDQDPLIEQLQNQLSGELRLRECI